MGERRYTETGRFVWHELRTADPESAGRYYAKLFGWSFKEVYRGGAGLYRVFGKDGLELGGMVPLEGSGEGSSFWLPYVTVEDADTGARDAERLGGRIVSPPAGVPGFGLTAVVEDPDGGRIAILSGGDPEEELPGGDPAAGTFAWNDLLSKNPEAAGIFYCGLVGWKLFTMDLGAGGTYRLLRRDDANEGGIILKPEQAEGPSIWLPYVAVTDIYESCVTVAHLGGSIPVPPSDLHGAGLYAVTADPEGGLLALFQPQSAVV